MVSSLSDRFSYRLRTSRYFFPVIRLQQCCEANLGGIKKKKQVYSSHVVGSYLISRALPWNCSYQFLSTCKMHAILDGIVWQYPDYPIKCPYFDWTYWLSVCVLFINIDCGWCCDSAYSIHSQSCNRIHHWQASAPDLRGNITNGIQIIIILVHGMTCAAIPLPKIISLTPDVQIEYSSRAFRPVDGINLHNLCASNHSDSKIN